MEEMKVPGPIMSEPVNLAEQAPAVVTTAAEPPIPQQPIVAPAPTSNYASFGKRLLAGLIDAVLVGITFSILSSIFGFDSSYSGGMTTSFGNPFNLLGAVYYIFMLVKYGATFGKMAMHIRVQDEITGQNLTIGIAILREVVGKFLSVIALGLGFLWMLWDPKKQTWHDKIAKSVVVNTKSTTTSLRRWFAVISC